MSRVQLETRRHSRAAALWAVLGGAAVGGAGVLVTLRINITLTGRLALVGAHLLAFGMVGDLWLAALLRYLSAQPSRSPVRPRLLSFIFAWWNAVVAVSAALFLVRGPVTGRLVLPIPFAGTLGALAIALLALPVVLRRQSGLPPTALHHLAGIGALVLGLVLGDLGYLSSTGARLELVARVLVLGGWLPLAGASLFYAAFDYESYEDKRIPLASVIAISFAALSRVAYVYGLLNPRAVSLFTQIAGFVVLFVFASVLRSRWHGGLTFWYERIAMAATVALAVCVFLSLDDFFGSPTGPIAGGLLLAASFYGCIVLWAGAFAVLLDQRDLERRKARLVIWPVTVGSLLAPAIAQLSSRVTGDAFDLMVGLGAVAVGMGVTVLGLHLLRRPRLRAVR